MLRFAEGSFTSGRIQYRNARVGCTPFQSVADFRFIDQAIHQKVLQIGMST